MNEPEGQQMSTETIARPARGAAGREAARKAAAQRRVERAVAELESQGYTVVLTRP